MPDKSSPLRVVILGGEWGVPSISPFGLKLVTWLKLVDLPHVVEIENDTTKGPKKKSPWVIFPDGERMGDSELIIKRLTDEYGVDSESGLSAEERARGLMIRRTFEDHYNFGTMHYNFVTDEGWKHTAPHFDFLPLPIRPLVKRIIRSAIRKETELQGIGRHGLDTIGQMTVDDLEAASVMLGDSPYFLGERPTLTDCSVFAFLALTIWSPIAQPPREAMADYANLVAFCERMRDEFWPEMSEPARLAA